MKKRKTLVRKTSSSMKTVSPSQNSSNRWIWITLAIIIVLAALYFGYKGITGNVITGNAASDPFTGAWDNFLKPTVEYLLGWSFNGAGNTSNFQDFSLMALLILLIVFSIVFIVVKSISFFNNPAHEWSVWVISLAVSLLAVRFLTAEWLVTILLPYSTLGIAISAGLPFVLFYFLVEKFPSITLKRIAWFFFGIIFLYLWYDRTTLPGAIALSGTPYYDIYLWTALFAAIMALFGQKAVERIKGKVHREKDENEKNKARANRELTKLHPYEANLRERVDGMISSGNISSSKFRSTQAELERVSARIAELEEIVFGNI